MIVVNLCCSIDIIMICFNQFSYSMLFEFSRMPGHWVQPPPPADEIWASYLVHPKWSLDVHYWCHTQTFSCVNWYDQCFESLERTLEALMTDSECYCKSRQFLPFNVMLNRIIQWSNWKSNPIQILNFVFFFKCFSLFFPCVSSNYFEDRKFSRVIFIKKQKMKFNWFSGHEIVAEGSRRSKIRQNYGASFIRPIINLRRQLSKC